jgi:uncharacterized radical SAM superfamily Fe-S cluster-containing enzyme
VPGVYETHDDAVYLTRSCPEHGESSRKVWDSLDHWKWADAFGPDIDTTASADLTVDGDHACLAVIEVTQDCNLSCSYCFASSGPSGNQLSVEGVVDLLETVREEGGIRPIQFSGGEPTVHDDLPGLIERARDMGFEHIGVNTNGIELARREGYAERLADAGVTAIYLQFDPTSSRIGSKRFPRPHPTSRTYSFGAGASVSSARCRNSRSRPRNATPYKMSSA